MEKVNPFNITFGKEPKNLISREQELYEIISSFENNNQPSDCYVISGPRGSGKTVSLSLISEYFKKNKKWIVIPLNPNLEMLEQLSSKLYDEGKLRKLFFKVDFNFSFKGLGFSINGDRPLLNVSSLLNKELDYLSKKDFNVLITIDEIVSNEFTKSFFQEYQILLRQKFNISLLMTGLYQNVNALQTNKSLSFLCRTPKIYLNNLNLLSISNQYKKLLNINQDGSIKFAKLTNGYAFAYQLVGSLAFSMKKKTPDPELIEKYDELLAERAYNLIFSELTPKEKLILRNAVKNNTNQNLIKQSSIKKNELSNYKKSFFLKGIIEKDYRSFINFSLPRFKEYLILMFKYFEN